MPELIAAVPTQAWMAGLLAGAIGGLAAALRHADPDDDPGECGPGCLCGCALDIGPHEEEITPGVRVGRGEWREEEL